MADEITSDTKRDRDASERSTPEPQNVFGIPFRSFSPRPKTNFTSIIINHILFRKMAATLVQHALTKIQLKNVPWRMLYATKAEKKKVMDRKVGPKIDSSAQSLAAKGFLRPQKDYTPPKDLTQRLDTILTSSIGSTDKTKKIETSQQKFAVLNACAEEFQHSVPNSLLHKVETLDDIYEFYNTPVSTITPLDKLKQMDLPPNLHIQYEYKRYNPATDTKFGGQTAFPRSSTLVTGLKYKDKYPGHIQNQTWPYNS